MTEQEIKKELKKYKDWLNNNHSGMYIKISDYSLNKYVKEQLTLTDVVGRSEQLTCPRCNSTNCLLPDKENDAECNDCGFIWAG